MASIGTAARTEAARLTTDPQFNRLSVEQLLAIAFLKGATHAYSDNKRLARVLEETAECSLLQRQAG